MDKKTDDLSFEYMLETYETDNGDVMPLLKFGGFEIAITDVSLSDETDENGDGEMTIEYKILEGPDEYDAELLSKKVSAAMLDVITQISKNLLETVDEARTEGTADTADSEPNKAVVGSKGSSSITVSET